MISFSNVSFYYKNNLTDKGNLNNINLEIKDGELIVLTGESGCGKTTFTRLLNGLAPNYYHGTVSGKLMMDGENIIGKSVSELGRKVGSVFQNPRSQFFNVDTDSELAFAAENIAMDPKEILKRLDEVTNMLDLKELRGRSIFELSGGEKQRIACGSVAVMHPKVVVLDEPSSNLDSASIDKLKNVIETWKNLGKTVIIAEHRLYYLKDLADRLIVIKDGTIAKEYSKETLANIDDQLKDMGLRPLCEPKIKTISAECNSRDQINIEELDYSYDRKTSALLLKETVLPMNQVTAIVGQNGTGKSTFLKCLCGIYKAKKDKILLSGRVWDRKLRNKACYLVFQDVNHQLFTESVLDELIIGMSKDISENEKRTEASNILERFGLLDVADNHPMALSGGQKQRVAIASSIASGRDILLMDEPTSGMDELNMMRLSKELGRLKEMGKTVYVVTHDYEFINECCDSVIRLE
ncbi:MAG: ABC transporter ATP-binding protein [Lachnospiraceae bacterium]|nr:ABC transporter ATP-binding protein [Lachnospiraceae bacterium]